MKKWLKGAGLLMLLPLFLRGLYLTALIDGMPWWYGWRYADSSVTDPAEMFVESPASRPTFVVPSKIDRTLVIDANSGQVPKQLIETFWYCLDSCKGPTKVVMVTNEATPFEQRVYVVTKDQVGQIVIRGVSHVHQDNRMLAIASTHR